MNRTTLGIAGIVCAPFLYIDFVHNGGQSNRISGLNGLIYMFGWTCSIMAIYRSGILGAKGRRLLVVQLVLLTLAQVYNLDLLIEDAQPNWIQRYLDPCWPLSNLALFAVAITILISAKTSLWYKLLPLAAGTWFPLLFTLMQVAPGSVGLIAGWYSAIGWTLLAFFAIIVKRTAGSPVTKAGQSLFPAGRLRAVGRLHAVK